jgi:hypothetical protein
MFRYVFILLLISSCGKIPIANKAKPAAIHKSPLYDTLNKGDINSIDKTGSDGNGNDANT